MSARRHACDGPGHFIFLKIPASLLVQGSAKLVRLVFSGGSCRQYLAWTSGGEQAARTTEDRKSSPPRVFDCGYATRNARHAVRVAFCLCTSTLNFCLLRCVSAGCR